MEDEGTSESESESDNEKEHDDSVDSLSQEEGNLLESTSNRQNLGITPIVGNRDQHAMKQSALMQKYIKYTKTPQAREGA